MGRVAATRAIALLWGRPAGGFKCDRGVDREIKYTETVSVFRGSNRAVEARDKVTARVEPRHSRSHSAACFCNSQLLKLKSRFARPRQLRFARVGATPQLSITRFQPPASEPFPSVPSLLQSSAYSASSAVKMLLPLVRGLRSHGGPVSFDLPQHRVALENQEARGDFVDEKPVVADHDRRPGKVA